MKTFFCAFVLFAASANVFGSAHICTEEEIVGLTKARIAKAGWPDDSKVEAVRWFGGRGGTWFVVISCNGCMDVDGGPLSDVVVLQYDRSGKIICEGMIGVTVCAKPKFPGGMSEASFKTNDARGNTIEITDAHIGDGGRVMSVKVVKRKR
jgi:hypothetical protein